MKKIKTIKVVLTFAVMGFLNSCSLEADNPNNLLEEGLNVLAFNPMVNGLEGVLTRAYGNILAPYSVGSDEMIWIGSRDAWQQLNFGNLDNPNNEFTDAAFFYVGEARYWADDVIKRGEEFSKEATFSDSNKVDLVRAYIYGAIIYNVIADMFDDFVVTSAKTEAGTPVGPNNMSNLYDTAVEYLNKGLSLNAGYTGELKALLARTHFSKQIWGKINPVNTSTPLVNSSAAVAAANEALSLLTTDFSFNLITSPTAPETVGGLDIAGEVNSRLEMRISDEYVISSDEKRPDAIDDGIAETTVSLLDPIDNIADPALFKLVYGFTKPELYPSLPIVTAREMYLILAEDALASGNTEGFKTQINVLRALDGLTPFSGQIDAVDLLLHSRRVNLFLQGRRIVDHYRFNTPSPYWSSSAVASIKPGTLLPITISEIKANPNIN